MPLEPTPFNELVDEFRSKALYDFSVVRPLLRLGWDYVSENSDKVYFCDVIIAKLWSEDFSFVVTRWGRRGRKLSFKIVKAATFEILDKIREDRRKHGYRIQFEIRGGSEAVESAREKVPDESVPLIPDYEEI